MPGWELKIGQRTGGGQAYLTLPQWQPPSYACDLGLEPPGEVGLSADISKSLWISRSNT